MSADVYQFMDSSNFPFTSYRCEKDILYDDATWEGILKHRKLILQVTSNYSFPVEVKHGACKIMDMPGTFIITSNKEPPNDPALLRRFHVVEVHGEEPVDIEGHEAAYVE